MRSSTKAPSGSSWCCSCWPTSSASTRPATAATGWGGDWGVAWRDGDRSCVTANFVGDDVTETEEMRQAFERWAESHDDARVVPAGAGGPFTVESCAG